MTTCKSLPVGIDFMSIVDNLSLAVEISQDGKLIYANPFFLKMFGCDSLDQITGRPVADFYLPKFRTLLDNYGDGCLGSLNPPVCLKMTALKNTGEPFDIEKRISSIDHGGIPLCLGVLIETEEIRALKEKLVQYQKMETIGTLTAGIAHDFNNILAAIMGNAEYANLLIAPEKSELRTSTENIIKACLRARDLAGHLLQFYRKTERKLKPTSSALIIKETVNLIKAVLPSNIKIHQNISLQQDTIMADPTQIYQVLMNLCTNAFHAMGEQGGVLKITLENEFFTPENNRFGLEPGNYAKITVQDNGCGMTDDVMADIFEPFFTTKTNNSGNGLGLSVSCDIVNNHGGAIDVISEAGKGSSFFVYLPLIDHWEMLSDSVAQSLPKGTGRILFVDDEELILDIGKRMMEHLGYEVTTKNSGMDALKAFGEDPYNFDLVITDMSMPDMSGDIVAEKLIEICRDIPIVLCSGNRNYFPEHILKRLGIKSLLNKPLTILELATTIEHFLRGRKPEKNG